MKIAALSSLLTLQGLACVTAFNIPSSSKSSFIRSQAKSNTAIQACENDEAFTKIFDPFNTQEKYDLDWSNEFRNTDRSRNNRSITSSHADTAHALSPLGVSAALVTAATALGPSAANAAKVPLSSGEFNPDNFRPVCPTSDGIYRFAQSTTQSLVGPDNFVEYGPLIAGGLLRVRLELCVVESFFNEAVGPFIEREGLRWVLPLHETVETFLAGTIFALASTFILVGSTKIVSVLITYGDVFIGAPCRLFGGFAFDRAKGKPVTLDIGFGPFKSRIIGPGDPKEKKEEETFEEIIDFSNVATKDLPIVIASGAVKTFGETSKIAREVFEGLDLFVGRYLTLIATGYISFKFLHFKVFPDFPPF